MPKFSLGQVVATPGALDLLRSSGHAASEFLVKHVNGDWGQIDGHDFKQNQIALRDGGRLVSAYKTRTNELVLVITEADRTSTCVLLPSDY